MKLYKFTKLEFALDIIKNNRLYLSAPEEFNDPFDCVLESSDTDLKAAGELITNYYNFVDLHSYVIANKHLFTKNQDDADKIIQHWENLKTTLFLYPRYTKFDFVEKLLKTSNAVDYLKIDAKRKEEYKYLIKKTMNDIRNKTLVYCFCKQNKSILMWSHYANAHKGACIEFEIPLDEKDLVEVIYDDKKTKFDIVTVTSMILALEFLKKEFDSSNQKFNLEIMKPYYTKSKEWSYEQEFRYIFHKNGTKRVFVEKGHYYTKCPKIVSITFGCRIDRNDLVYKEIVNAAKLNNIMIKHASVNVDSFSLDELSNK